AIALAAHDNNVVALLAADLEDLSSDLVIRYRIFRGTVVADNLHRRLRHLPGREGRFIIGSLAAKDNSGNVLSFWRTRASAPAQPKKEESGRKREQRGGGDQPGLAKHAYRNGLASTMVSARPGPTLTNTGGTPTRASMRRM